MQRKTLPLRRNPLALSAGALVVQAVFGTCAGAVLLALPSTARAQASTAADTSAQTIVITTTARKKSELAQEVPITMDVIGGREIKDSGITRVQDIQANVPGLVIDTLESSGRISLRGVGTGDLGLGTDQSVAIHVDGVYQVFGSAGLARFFDIDRVEVLRGPQGTLYGRNATAGVINASSKACSMCRSVKTRPCDSPSWVPPAMAGSQTPRTAARPARVTTTPPFAAACAAVSARWAST
jgi:iron complex outermembrane receptor protein